MKNILKTACPLLVAGILFIGCAGKDGAPGPQGATGNQGDSGPSAKKYSYTLTFGPGVTRQMYSGVPVIGSNDAIFTYIKYQGTTINNTTYVLLPLTVNGISYIAEQDVYGDVFVDVVYADGTTGSPLSASTTFSFYSIVVKGEAGTPVARSGSIDYGNYKEVKAYYNLQD